MCISAASQEVVSVTDRAAYRRAHYLANKDEYKARAKARRESLDRAELRQYYFEYRKNNREKILDIKRRWSETNREKDRAIKSAWAKNNKGKVNATTKRYKLAKKKRTPSWLTKEHLRYIEEYYVLAQDLSWLSESPLEVDHIVPLSGAEVCGLHVPWNLQILTKEENSRKRNKYE